MNLLNSNWGTRRCRGRRTWIMNCRKRLASVRKRRRNWLKKNDVVMRWWMELKRWKRSLKELKRTYWRIAEKALITVQGEWILINSERFLNQVNWRVLCINVMYTSLADNLKLTVAVNFIWPTLPEFPVPTDIVRCNPLTITRCGDDWSKFTTIVPWQNVLTWKRE